MENTLDEKISESIKSSQPIYHYMSFYKFYRLINTKSLHFVNPLTAWEDKKEGYFFRLVRELNLKGNEKYKQFLVEKIRENFSKNTDEILRLIETGNVDRNSLNELDWHGVRCQSWTFKGNCKKFWDEYAKKEGVCISSKMCYLRKDDSVLQSPIEWIVVKYKDVPEFNKDNEVEIQNYLEGFVEKMRLDSNAMSVQRVYEYKEPKYRWEDEFRIHLVSKEKEKYVDRKMLSLDFIKSVKVHPEASDEFCKCIEKFCKDNSISGFEGKAKLLDSYCCCRNI